MQSIYPHVIFHVTRHHQDVGNFINRSVLVQQTQVGWYFGWKQGVERLLMEQIVNVAANFISASISEKEQANRLRNLVSHPIKFVN